MILAAARGLALSAERYRQRRKCITTLKLKVMVTVKFSTVKLYSGTFLIFPTVLIDKSQKKAKATIAICFAWINGLFEVSIKWTRKVTNQETAQDNGNEEE